MKRRDCLGQIWIETVIYTLILMVLIGLALSYVNPKIESFKDKTAIEKTFNFLKNMDNTINEVKSVPGNKRVIGMTISDGKIEIDGEKDTITFEIDSRYQYSEPGKNFSESGFNVTTISQGKYNKVKISKDYSPIDITYNGEDRLKTISFSSVEYKFSIASDISEDKTIIDIYII